MTAERVLVPRRRQIVTLSLFILVLAAAAARYLAMRGVQPGEIAATFIAFILLLVTYLGCGFPRVAGAFQRFAAAGPGSSTLLVAFVALPPTMALVSLGGSGSLVHAAWLALYGGAIAFLLAWAQRLGPPPNLVDVLAVLSAWLPVEFGFLKGLWSGSHADPSYVIGKILSVSILLMGFAAIRPLEGFGYRWRLRFEDIATAFVALVAFLAFAVPAGLLSGFVVWQPKALPFGEIAFRSIAIGLFIALPEEILFRGVIFNLLQKWWVGRWGPFPALILSSLIFGMSHLNNFPYGDVRYAILATYAGFCYAWCYLRTGNLMAGVMTHAAVDLIHKACFGPPS